jgi:hypothetical protein
MTEYQQLLKHIKRKLELAESKSLCSCSEPGHCAGTSSKLRCRSDNNIPYAQETRKGRHEMQDIKQPVPLSEITVHKIQGAMVDEPFYAIGEYEFVLLADHNRAIESIRAGFPNIDAMRDAMIATADENSRLKSLLSEYRSGSYRNHVKCSQTTTLSQQHPTAQTSDDRCDLCKRTDAEMGTPAMAAIREAAEGLHKAGVIDKKAMKKF